MKIVIDARLYSQSGVGRYLQKLIENLALIDKKNHYVIFLNQNDYQNFKINAPNFRKKLINIKWHSLIEQLFLPLYLVKEHPDLVHFPYFSVPILYPGKFIVTIHDLIIDHFDTGRASTHNIFFYKVKRLAYKLLMSKILKRALRVITVSQTTKEEIINHYQIDSQKIVVTYEAAQFKSLFQNNQKPLIHYPYILYVGNAYPHKNLERLIEAFYLVQKQFNKLKLVLVGKKDFFYQRLEKKLNPSQKKNIIIFGFATEKKLANLYKNAIGFVFPSLMEGFGLPPLEAMSFGCPVIAANSSSIPEVCGKAALYFNPKNTIDIAEKIKMVIINKKIRNRLVKKGYVRVKKYSWKKLAKKTLSVYEEILRNY